MRKHLVLTALVLALLAGCAAAPYEPAGAPTGDEALDGQVLTLLQEICDPRASEEENLRAAYDWVCNEITYRAGTADTTGGFTEDLIQALAREALEKRKGNCDSEAALMAVLLQRLGCEAQVVQGQFLRKGTTRPSGWTTPGWWRKWRDSITTSTPSMAAITPRTGPRTTLCSPLPPWNPPIPGTGKNEG